MKKQAMNPYLPLGEYIPDGEPRLFNDRLYIYGSHDMSHGKSFCVLDYVCYSASIDDLSDWKYEGVILKKEDDLPNRNPIEAEYAPDCVKGPDGRYYLYFAPANDGAKESRLGVAVCDTPCGEFKYLADVNLPKCNEYAIFDPGVLVDDDNRVWLYYGFAFNFGKGYNVLKTMGGAVVELSSDMHTVISKPKMTLPNMMHAKGEKCEGHAFFEASSIRKFNNKYYFIYSSQLSHELCYAISDKPDGPFDYKGTLVSNIDVGLNGRTNKNKVNCPGNNHGSLICVKGQYYIFYHRQTQGTSYSRQGCAEKIYMNEDGTFNQVEITSCGLNDGPLATTGTYSFAYACNIIGKHVTEGRPKNVTRYDEEGSGIWTTNYIANIYSNDVIGFKYFDFKGDTKISVEWRVNHDKSAERKIKIPTTIDGVIEVYAEETCTNKLASMEVKGLVQYWNKTSCSFNLTGTKPLYFKYIGNGNIDLNNLIFEK